MSRILFLIVLLVVGYLLLKSLKRRKTIHFKKNKRSGLLRKKETMLRCEYCGLHVPESEAVKYGGKNFCSLEHAQLHTQRDT